MKTTHQRLAALSLAILSMAILFTAPTRAAIVADSVAEFSGVQGQDDWQYGYDSGGFVASPTFNAGGTMFGFGSAGVWEGVNNIRHVAEGSHPTTAGGTKASIRRWTSDVAGIVKIQGTLKKFDANGNGVIGVVRLNTTAEVSQFIAGGDLTGVNYTKYLTVAVGDTVDFVVGANGDNGSDSTNYTGTIETVAAGTQIFDLADDFNFATNNAASQWQYVKVDGNTRDGSYTFLTSSTDVYGAAGLDGWTDSETFPAIAKNTNTTTSSPFGNTDVGTLAVALHPDGGDGNGIGWLAPADGTVDIDGFVKLSSRVGGAVDWFIDLGDSSGNLASGSLAFATALNDMDSFDLNAITVSAGDIIYLHVLDDGVLANDLTQVSMQIAFTAASSGAPEPSSLLLAAMGVLGLLTGSRRRRSRACF